MDKKYRNVDDQRVETESREWSNLKSINDGTRPKSSDGSQFHQPPHVPSWRAHQLPKKRAMKFTIMIFVGHRTLSLDHGAFKNCSDLKKFTVSVDKRATAENKEK